MSPLEQSVDGLRRERPEFSAFQTVTRNQALALIGLGVVAVVGLLINPTAVMIAVLAATTGLYLVSLVYRTILLRIGLRHPHEVTVSDGAARAIPDDELPIYTVLVPAYHEAELIARTIAALEAIAYPPERLDVKLLLEADDRETIDAARSIESALKLEIVLIPPGLPRTKPKACNYGLLQARGEFITIYDAEDRPEPLQLRRAVAAFRQLAPLVACLQAKLSYHNVHQNLITRWFTAEYETWFSLSLPALAQIGGPIPLGGTSMHISRRVLEAVGAWDPYNVTEDADLGIRLQRFGYRVAVLDSTTLEEANSDAVNWVRQRSRWYKGYLQTWLVHMRHPIRLWGEVGWRAGLGINLLLGAVPFLAVLNPIFWMLTALWFIAKPHWLVAVLPAPIYYPALISMLAGNFIAFYTSVIAIRVRNRPELLPAVLLSPLYWAMMAIAAIRALAQLAIAPSFWEKSVHGLDATPAVDLVSEHAAR
ncbi:MAG: glycosyltransferase [Candidatus Dormibacteraeota bacterium]|nr:glycosyltransferase [Candidatus Dormibacteraeota bacterium]